MDESPVGPDESAATEPGDDAAVSPTVPEQGVPGIDSDLLVCRSWSRIAGSFQVVAVSAAFGSGDSLEIAELEVLAAASVTAAYRDLVQNWPTELEAEAEAVADRFLGPFARRSERAANALRTTIADSGLSAEGEAEVFEVLNQAWVDALTRRDPTSEQFVVDLDEELRGLVSAAAIEFDAQVPAVPLDPSLVTDVEVPLTEAYLARNCPDRGTLGGTEIDS